MKNLSLQITSPSFLDDSFTSQIDLVTGKPFYHSEWGRLFTMLPWDVQESIASAIWRYVFSNKVIRIPTPIKFLEPGELHRNRTKGEWVSEKREGAISTAKDNWYRQRAIKKKMEEMADMVVKMIRQKNPGVMTELFDDTESTTDIFRRLMKDYCDLAKELVGTEEVKNALLQHPNWTEEVVKWNVHMKGEDYAEFPPDQVAVSLYVRICSQRNNGVLYSLERVKERAEDYVNKSWEQRKHSLPIYERAREVATKCVQWGSYTGMCPCMNKDGTVCGAKEVNHIKESVPFIGDLNLPEVYDTKDGDNCLPLGITLRPAPLSYRLERRGRYQGRYLLAEMPTCRKHQKEMAKRGADVVINETLEAWGYGNRHGYMIRTDKAGACHEIPSSNRSDPFQFRMPPTSKRVEKNISDEKYKLEMSEHWSRGCFKGIQHTREVNQWDRYA